MFFYKIECRTEEKYQFNDSNDRKKFAEIISLLSEDACASFFSKADFRVAKIKDNLCSIIVIAEVEFVITHTIRFLCNDFLKKINIKGTAESIREITGRNFLELLRLSERFGYIETERDILERYNLINFNHIFSFKESILEKGYTFSSAKKKAENILCGQSLVPEIERIYSTKNPNFFAGHPVHYIVMTNDSSTALRMCELLLSCLNANHRLLSKRYALYNVESDRPIAIADLEGIYKSFAGGSVIIKCNIEENDSEYANRSEGQMQILCDLMKKYRQNVLTIICFNRDNQKLKNQFLNNIADVEFIELNEEVVFTKKAKTYLKQCAKEKGVTNCTSLYKQLPKTEQGYLTADLNKIFDKWYDKYLRTGVYAQYASIESTHIKILRPKGNAYTELQELVGLSQAKLVIKQALDYCKVQKLFRERGLESGRPSMHMVFSGNPGTAKTTVARLISQIMKDNGVLSNGDLYEVGRADLVGKYVGWTAQIVKDKFKQAKGSILFIDEAYSLVDDRSGLYGDEAINTIVQEMENSREDMIVIFAGYPNEMDVFLKHNPGLSSRIAFQIDFPDYTTTELLEILQLMIKKEKMQTDKAAYDKLCIIFSKAVHIKDFGNGRFVRNILEKAKMRQASRLIEMGYDKVTEEDIHTLIADDFEMPDLKLCTKLRSIGFNN